MAKGSLFTGVMTGKLGNAVLFRIKNSNSKEKQGSRSYVARIANPQSQGQARQRLCLSNIVQNYKQLREVIRRGFEGVPYGGESYNKYLRLNMTNYNGAYVDKGVQTPVPFSAIISQGSLIPVEITAFNPLYDDASSVYFKGPSLGTDLVWPDNMSLAKSVGDAMRALIAANTCLKDGDQLTFVMVSAIDSGNFVYRVASLTLNVNDERGWKGGFDFDNSDSGNIDGHKLDNANGVSVSFSLAPSGVMDEIAVAGAVIISRDSGNGSYLRSNATLACDFTNEALKAYYSDEAFAGALASYMGIDADNVDWPVEPDEEGSSASGLVGLPVTVNVPANAGGEHEAFSYETTLLGRQVGDTTYMLTRKLDGDTYCCGTGGQIEGYVSISKKIQVKVKPAWVRPSYETKPYYSRYGKL